MKRLLLITSGDVNKASVRTRVLNYIPLLKEAGWEVEVMEPIGNKTRSARLRELLVLLYRAIVSGVVLIQKRLFPAWGALLLRAFSSHLVFEFDDPVFLNMEGNVNPWRKTRLEAMLRLADVVTVDNVGLQEYASNFNPNTLLIPSCVDTAVFSPRRPAAKGDGRFVIGWIGNPSNLDYISDIEQALADLNAQYRDAVVLKVICNEAYHSGTIPVINKRWRLKDEPDDIASFDVGIVPLRDYAWTRYKIAFRPYLFMAMECPVVISPFGPSANVIEDGCEGFVARAPDEWTRALNTLIMDPEMARRMGKAGRSKVERGFTYRANLPKLLRALGPDQ